MSDLVFQPQLLEQDRGLDAVGRLGRVQVDVGRSLGCHFGKVRSYSPDARCH